jgi:uncharacterized membrane protein YhaH (DUF805 family)
LIDQSAHVGMTPMKWALRPLQRYADFNGRAPRAEYWWFAFGSFVASLPTGLLDRLFFGPLYGDFGPLSVVQVLLLVVLDCVSHRPAAARY